MALTTAQQALLLFKKWLGLGQTTSSREFFNETSFPGRSAVYTNQIWTQADLIPSTAPALSNGQTSGVVQYWQNAPLGAVPGTTNAFTSSLLIDAIPFNYGDGSSYNYVIRNNIGGTIAFGEGDWIVDTDAGLVTFYSTVPGNMPPNISFYKYVGAKGFSSGSVPLTGSLFGTASWASNVISASFATTASAATSITFIPSTASFATTSSFAVTASYALNSTELPPNLVSSSTQIDYTQIQNKPTTIETASYVEYNNVANKPALVSSSQQINTGSFSGSFIGTASIADKVTGGTSRYIPMWTGSGANELTSSIIYQTTKGVFIGYDTAPHFHSAVGETLAVHSGETGVKNVIYAHGSSDDSYRVNIRNISSGVSASTNFIATADAGTDDGGYIRMGINSSTYSRTDEIGDPLDAYLFTTGSDLLIGNLSPDKRIILFTGPGDADNNARVFIDPSGSVGINTSEVIAGAPDALRVKAVPSVATFNVITALGLTDDYAQINMKNTGTGNSVSSDIVATANNGDENTNFVNMGINGETYTGTIGGPNDSYVYSTGGHLHLGAIDPGEEIMLFVGGEDVMMTTKLTLRDNNQHELSGSLNVTGSLNVLQNVVNNLTASFAITASYVEGAASDWSTLANKPDGIVSSSTQVQNYNIFTTTGSNAFKASQTITGSLIVTDTITAQQFNIEFISSSVIYESGSTKFGDSTDDTHQFTGSLSVLGTISGSLVLPIGTVSSSAQVDYNGIQNKPTTIATASYVEYNNVVNKPTLISSSLQINTGSFSGSITTASFATTASFSQTSSFTVSSSFATTASAATSITFTPSTASFAQNAQLLNNTSSAVFATTGSNSFNGTQTITGSLLLTTDIVVFSGSFTTSGSFAISGSLGVTGGITGSLLGSSSFATTASAATSITFTPSSASFSTTSSFATTASAANSITFTPASASFATTSSFAQNARLLNNTGSATFATTGSNTFNGTQTITGSLLLASDTVTFTGSFTTSGSFTVSGSLGVSGGITGSLLGSSSFATTASAATSITFTPTSASFATTASAANSITFIPTSASFATTASAATSITFTPTSASFATTSSYAVTSSLAISASFIDGGFY